MDFSIAAQKDYNIIQCILFITNMYITKNSAAIYIYLILYRRLLWAAIVLLPILGSTWIIGMISVNSNFTGFAWIFTILNSFQV